MKTSKSAYERFSDHATSNWSLLVGFLWGFAEATLFFIVPDVYLGFVALFNWRRGLWVMMAALVGALLGGSIMYILAMNDPSSIRLVLTRVPLIDIELINDVATQLRTDGLITILTGPLKGTPYKIYAAQAGEQSLPLLSFSLMTIPARLERFFPVVLAFGSLGKRFETFCKENSWIVVCSYALL